MDLSTTITAIKSAVSSAKKLAELSKDIDNLELQKEIVDLRGMLVDIEHANIDLIERIKELEQALDIKESLEFDENNGYYFTEEDDKKKIYCPVCHVKDEKVSRMRHRNDEHFTGYICDTCGKSLGKNHPIHIPDRKNGW